MYLQPQTAHKHTLTKITELAAIFGGMLTMATLLDTTRIGINSTYLWLYRIGGLYYSAKYE